jgi:hypothetical protein
MSSIFDWSSTASSNTACDGIGVNTGMSPASVDNVFRSLMALIRGSFASALQTFLAGSAALPIANGGTGATTAATALTALGGLEDDYRDLVRVVKSASFTLANSERGSGIVWTNVSPGTATIDPLATTPINLGAVFVIYNAGAALTVTRGAGVTLQVSGSTTSTDAIVATGGQATLIHWGDDFYTITGPGVS